MERKCQDAFEKLKVALTTAPVLGFPRESGGIFICDTDASKDALGSVLCQEQDGQERLIAYYSVSTKLNGGTALHAANCCQLLAQSNIFIRTYMADISKYVVIMEAFGGS